MTSSPRLSIVLPAHNEREIIREAVTDVADQLAARMSDFEVIIVENGSIDGTADICKALAAERSRVRLISVNEPDYGTALRLGLLAAEGDAAILFDVDFYDLSFVDTALRLLDAGADVVLATKRGKTSSDLRSWYRRLITFFFTGILHLLFGLRASDTHGIKALKTETLKPLILLSTSRRDLYDTELVLRAERAGMRIEEVSVNVIERRAARLSILTRVFRTLLDLAVLRVRLWRSPSSRACEGGQR